MKHFVWIFLLAGALASSAFVTLPTAMGATTPHPSASTVLTDTTAPVFTTTPLISPTNGSIISDSVIALNWLDATDDVGVISYTVLLTGTSVTTPTTNTITSTYTVTSTASAYTYTNVVTSGLYSWTVRAYDSAGNISSTPAPYTFTFNYASPYVVQIFQPLISRFGSLQNDNTGSSSCPTTSLASYELIPINGPPADRPDFQHGDLNLNLRGWVTTTATLGLVDYSGATDGNAPQLAGLFSPNRLPAFTSAYQVYNWDWGCSAVGCPTTPIASPDVTMAGFETMAGETINIVERSPEIYPGGYVAMVLYAAEQRITIGYTRDDSVANGYAVHIEGVCVDPNLLALYQAQVDSSGFHSTGQLPGLRNDQAIGTALGTEIQAVVRDRGSFMDPRSRKDWWFGYRPALETKLDNHAVRGDVR